MTKTREELLQSLIEKMSCVMKNMRAKHDFPFGEFKLSRPQVMILFYIAKNKGNVSSKDLAAVLNVTSGAITQFMKKLVDKGLVKREEDPKDRRVLRISLTEAAKEKFFTFRKDYYKAVSPIFKELDETEIGQFINLLEKIHTES